MSARTVLSASCRSLSSILSTMLQGSSSASLPRFDLDSYAHPLNPSGRVQVSVCILVWCVCTGVHSTGRDVAYEFVQIQGARLCNHPDLSTCCATGDATCINVRAPPLHAVPCTMGRPSHARADHQSLRQRFVRGCSAPLVGAPRASHMKHNMT